MKAESYTHLFGMLADALKHWAHRLTFLAYAEATGDEAFREVNNARLKLVERLRADQRDDLTQGIDQHLIEVKEKGKAFTLARLRGSWEQGGTLWEVPLMRIDFMDPAYSEEFRWATEDLCVALYDCDELFEAIQKEFYQAFLRNVNKDKPYVNKDEPHNKEEPNVNKEEPYTKRFESVGYLPRKLYTELKISDGSLNNYAKKAGVGTPGRGKGRTHRYSLADVEVICRYVIDQVTIDEAVNNAKRLLLEIERKSKIES